MLYCTVSARTEYPKQLSCTVQTNKLYLKGYKMDNKQIDSLIDTIDRKCDIVLEQLRINAVEPDKVIEQLKDTYNQLGEKCQ